jgi:hypothetical protein
MVMEVMIACLGLVREWDSSGGVGDKCQVALRMTTLKAPQVLRFAEDDNSKANAGSFASLRMTSLFYVTDAVAIWRRPQGFDRRG